MDDSTCEIGFMQRRVDIDSRDQRAECARAPSSAFSVAYAISEGRRRQEWVNNGLRGEYPLTRGGDTFHVTWVRFEGSSSFVRLSLSLHGDSLVGAVRDIGERMKSAWTIRGGREETV